MSFYIDGRKIRIVTGTRSQTINVFVDNDTLGIYDPKLRITDPNKFVTEQLLEDKSFSSIEDMVAFLQREHGARLENMSQIGTSKLYQKVIPIDEAWIENIIPEVEQAINAIIDEFIHLPYLHRVEHSIHCEIYRKLSNSRLLNQLIDFGTFTTGAIHKEWPETRIRSGHGRRGNFDLAILGPTKSYQNTITHLDLLCGLLEPAVVIEVGLDYGIDHLKNDVQKLRNSGVRYGYILHLARPTGISQEGVYEYIKQLIKEEENSVCRVAYASIDYNEISYRKLYDSSITTISIENYDSRAGDVTDG